MKIFYLRDKSGFPVTCVASKIVHPLAGQPMVYFDFATHNPADRYDRARARKTAIARLEKHGRYGVYLRAEKGETRRAIVEEIASVSDSQAARDAAYLWLQKEPSKILSEAAAKAVHDALPIINELFGRDGLESAMEQAGYSVDWKQLWKINADVLSKKVL